MNESQNYAEWKKPDIMSMDCIVPFLYKIPEKPNKSIVTEQAVCCLGRGWKIIAEEYGARGDESSLSWFWWQLHRSLSGAVRLGAHAAGVYALIAQELEVCSRAQQVHLPAPLPGLQGPLPTVCHKPSHLCVCIPDGFCVSTFLLIRIRIPVRWGSLWPPQLELHLDVIASLQALCPCTGLGLGLQQRNVREAQFSPKQIYTFVNIRGTVYLNCIHFIRCKLYLNKVGIF